MNSSLYRELSELELSNLVSESLHTSIRYSKLMTGGLFNTTYYIDAEKYGALVLRIGPVNRHLLLPYEHNLMRAEQSVYSLYREAGVHVPEVLYIDTSKNIIDRDYMIVRYIPSVPMSSAKLNANDNARICYEIGVDVAKMHSITGSRFGRIPEVENGGGYTRWSDCIVQEFNLWASMAKPTSLFSDTEYMRIKKIFEKSVPVLDEIQVPKLVHADLWEGNILIRTDSAPEFAAIIDADRAIWGDPEIEFSSILWTHNEPSFWAGYGKDLKQDTSDLIRRAIYTLLWSLLNAYVYMREYNQPGNANEEKNRALQQADFIDTLL